jgi:hypothetical protein
MDREIWLQQLDQFLESRDVRQEKKFLQIYELVVDDMDRQYLSMRKARKELYDCDDKLYDRIDLETWRSDEMINWNVDEVRYLLQCCSPVWSLFRQWATYSILYCCYTSEIFMLLTLKKPVREPSRLPSLAPAPLGQVQLSQQTLNTNRQLAAAFNSVINAALLAFPGAFAGGGGGGAQPLPQPQPNAAPLAAPVVPVAPVAPNVQAGSTAIHVQPHTNTAAANTQTLVTGSITVSVGGDEDGYDIEEGEDAEISDGGVL